MSETAASWSDILMLVTGLVIGVLCVAFILDQVLPGNNYGVKIKIIHHLNFFHPDNLFNNLEKKNFRILLEYHIRKMITQDHNEISFFQKFYIVNLIYGISC